LVKSGYLTLTLIADRKVDSTMVAHIKTVAFQGIHVTEVEVQVQVSPGLPAFMVVGLPDKAVAESRERVRAAILSLGLALPAKRIIVNLAPADLGKEGSHFDLPIALGLLAAMGVVPHDAVSDYYVLGELSLDGRILPVSGILPAAVGASAAGQGIICPAACGREAAWAGELEVLAPTSLAALLNHIKGRQVLSPPAPPSPEAPPSTADLRDVRGQYAARRALEIAAAGGHNLLMMGPPGTGKSLLASCLPGILPPMTAKEILEVSMIYSVAGAIVEGRLSQQRPFRAPHYSASIAAMVGGGQRAKPGEISLAHHGVLFLDELPEYSRTVLESLRQPMETGEVTVARVNAHLTYPALFQMVAAMNPCRCGYVSDPALACGKAPRCAEDYQSKISGPLLDRMDLHVEVPMLDTAEMMNKQPGESSADVARRIAAARTVQQARYADASLLSPINARASGNTLESFALPDATGQKLLEEAAGKFKLSMRAYTRILRVARTIADLEGAQTVRQPHVAEALSYRRIHYGKALEAA